MDDAIILTKKLRDGIRLQRSMTAMDPRFADLRCMTKESIAGDPLSAVGVTVIFSTWYMPEFTEEEIASLLPSLEAIFYAAGTVKYFAEPFLKRGIRVFSAAGANGVPVAEFVAAQIVLTNKGYFQAQKAYRWPIRKRGFAGARRLAERKPGNYGAKVGIVGCGAIGSKVAELLRPYKLDVFVYDPYVPEERIADLHVGRADDLPALFSMCDVVTNHLPDIPDTRGLIDYSLLSLMKPTATFINTGRGRQVDEKALAKVLKEKPEMCALLDVTQHEPLWPWSPLYRRKNVFLTPHIAGSLSGEFGRMVEYMIQAHDDMRNGKHNPGEIDYRRLTQQA